jgi:hypothetical protein
VKERSCEDRLEGAMIKQICLEDYKAAANSALKFPPFRQAIVKAVTDEVKREMRTYSKGNSVAKYNGNPLSLKDFKSDDMLLEMKERLPVTHAIVTATSNNHTRVKFLENKQILAFSALLNTWLRRTNFIYRLNLLLSKGCCKTEIMDLFHRLGLASHPNTIRAQLQSAANLSADEILSWKTEIEVNRKKANLMDDVLKSQTQSSQIQDTMEICSIDFSRETVEKYQYFDTNNFELCKNILPSGKFDNIHEDSESLPYYRCGNDE